ncbi:zinc finger protein 184 isoform X2 [Procambarus clarkii]|uniref:zinc finger protein 184 isoform X2 n=1 Tax=Procambarus clarkii TaxID=6728 RepID=UPI001E674F55|nr:zinc finger protein 2-like isoform X2 [Procambarus clarkii]XP_045593802.1 zinc finger protein 2-like isoform X2 [Procambarus clarkii]
MDHFLSGLDHGPNPWYAPRPPVTSHGHEFSIGSFQLIPISGNSNHISSNHSPHTVPPTPTSQQNIQSAFKPPADSSKVKSEVKDEDERNGSKTPSPSVALTPLSTNMAHHSHKAKNSERWDTKKVCNICGKVLSRGDKLKNHIRTHTNNFPFHCDTCGQGFLRSEGLRVHNRIHTGERPYVCMVCGKAYTRKDKLTRHAIVHTGERPFVCQHCGKSFTRKDKMQRHEMIHKVEKPFTCVPCNLEFVRQETFNAHMERKHPERLPYTVVQHARSGSPGYNPQGLNLSDSKSGIKLSLGSSKQSNSSTSTSSTTTTSSASFQSGPSLTGGSSVPAGTSLTSGHSLLSGTSLLAGSPLTNSSALLSSVLLPSGSGAHALS